MSSLDHHCLAYGDGLVSGTCWSVALWIAAVSRLNTTRKSFLYGARQAHDLQVFVESCSKVIPFDTLPVALQGGGIAVQAKIYSTCDWEVVCVGGTKFGFGVAFNEGF